MKYFYLIAISFLIIFLTPYFFKIKKISCQSQFGMCSSQIISNLENFEDLNYKKLDTEINSFLETNLLVEKYSYYFVPPNTLKVNVIEKTGVIALKVENYDKYKIVSDDLTVISEIDQTHLPVIYIENEDKIKLDSTKFAVELMKELSRYYSINEAILAENLKIVYDGTTEIIFPSSGDIDVLLGTLEIMLFQLNQRLIDSKISLRAQDVKMIDLRNRNPIIR